MNYYIKAIQKYGDFDGRASMEEYWMFFLINIFFAIGAIILDHVAGTTFTSGDYYGYVHHSLYGFFSIIYCLFIIIPHYSASVRWLHDTGKSGWYVLVPFIPIAGAIWLLVLLASSGQLGDNEYGVDPLAKEHSFLLSATEPKEEPGNNYQPNITNTVTPPAPPPQPRPQQYDDDDADQITG